LILTREIVKEICDRIDPCCQQHVTGYRTNTLKMSYRDRSIDAQIALRRVTSSPMSHLDFTARILTAK